MLKPGDIVLVDFPYSNLKKIKRRAVLVLDVSEQDILTSYITTKVSKYINRETSVRIEPEDLSFGRMKSSSLVRLEKINYIDSRFCKRVAALNKNKLDEILRGYSNILPANTTIISIKKKGLSPAKPVSPMLDVFMTKRN